VLVPVLDLDIDFEVDAVELADEETDEESDALTVELMLVVCDELRLVVTVEL
jgi:hypothetical protein